jgi:uncharacterized integral membrane protein
LSNVKTQVGKSRRASIHFEVTDVSRLHARIRFLNFITSRKFTFISVAIAFAVHVSVWLLFSGISTAVGHPFFSAYGCLANTALVGVATAQILVYCLLCIIYAIAVAIKVRDTYNIMYEVIGIVVVYVLMVIVFIIMNTEPSYVAIYEHYFASGWLIPLTVGIDSIVTALVPTLLTFRKSNNYNAYHKQDESDSERQTKAPIDILLEDEAARDDFKEFAVASFCPESIRKYKLLFTNTRSLLDGYSSIQIFDRHI